MSDRTTRHGRARGLWIPLCLGTALAAGWSGAQESASASAPAPSAGAQWWRGNTHTHTLWSDGDAPPDLVAKRYRDAGYNFLILSDHNVLSRGERWFPVEESGRLTPTRLDAVLDAVGEELVEVREVDAEGGRRKELRLPTLQDVRLRYEDRDRFLMIEGEEITDSFEGRPVHVNGINLGELIPPQGGTSFLETVQRNVDAVREQGERLGRSTLAHLNHPNFGWAVRDTSDLVGLRGEAFMEIYNGHPSTREAGNEEHASVEDLWDQVNVSRGLMGLPFVMGFATDDSHHHYDVAPQLASMGRGWVMVRAVSLEPDAIVDAMRAGDFYASSGVSLADVRFSEGALTVDIAEQEGVTYETVFVGGVRDEEDTWTPSILARTSADPAVYETSGTELFVRAMVTSSRLHPHPQDDPPGAAEHEKAWTQPIAVRR